MLEVSAAGADADSHCRMLSSGSSSVGLATRKEPLLFQSLGIERRLLLEESFVPAAVEVAASALETITVTKVLIGAHRFDKVHFYATPQIDAANVSGGRRSSLSLLQMFLSPPSSNGETNSADCSAASASIKEMLARNPGLAQLLTSAASSSPSTSINTTTTTSSSSSFSTTTTTTTTSSLSSSSTPLSSSTGRRMSLAGGTRPREVFFSLVPEGPLLAFPQRALVMPHPNGDLHIKFIPACVTSSAPSSHSLMIIERATGALTSLLLPFTRDPTCIHAEYLGKISQLPAVAYREICFPCLVPVELGNENLVKLMRSSDSPSTGSKGRGGKSEGGARRRPHSGNSNGRKTGKRASKQDVESLEADNPSPKADPKSVSSPTLPLVIAEAITIPESNVRRSSSVGALQPQFVPIKKRKYLIRNETP